ncbi:MAG: MauE/DoxX family redox-associated membrane protein [Bacteroidia bacterium]
MKFSIRLILAFTFLVSALLKLSGIDGFELFVFKTLNLNWMLTTIYVRLLISLELGIGLFYLFGIGIKQTNSVALILISVFSIWLSIQWLSGNDENCHCFGEMFQMNAAESLIKNAIILIFVFLLFRVKDQDLILLPKPFLKVAPGVVLVISFLTPFIFSPPDFLVAHRYNLNGVADNIDFEKLDSIPWKNANNPIDITKGKNIVLFMSMQCNMCQKAAKKISIMDSRHPNAYNISYIFFGDSANLKPFWEKSESTQFPYKIISSKQFYSITKQMPTVFFLNEGKVIKALGYRNLNDKAVTSFLGMNY